MTSKQHHENRENGENFRKLEKRRARALTAMRERMRNFVECPDPENGELDEYTRIMNRSEAAAMAVSGLAAADAARVLANAASIVEEDNEAGDGCLSTLVGEALRLQMLEHAFEAAALAGDLERTMAKDLYGDGPGDWDDSKIPF